MGNVPRIAPTTDNLIDIAAQQMHLDGLPEGVAELGFAVQLLLALCRELQRLNEREGRDNFILPCRLAARKIGLSGPHAHVRVHRLLTKTLPGRGWIELVEPGSPRRRDSLANTYRYLGDAPPSS